MSIDSSEFPLLSNLRDENYQYAVITPSVNPFEDYLYFGFNGRKAAADKAKEIQKHGLWCAIFELSDMHLTAYLTGWCLEQ